MTSSAISAAAWAKRPWAPIALLAGLVLAALLVRPPQALLAGAALGLFAWLAAASPVNGFWYLFLLGACFLGAPGRPWFWLFEAHVWLWLLMANLHLLGKGGPGGGRLWLIPLVSLAAVPLGLTELGLKLWVTPWPVLGQQLLAPDVKYPVYPLSEFLKRLGGVLVAVTAWRLLDLEQARQGLRRLAPQLAMVVLGLCLAAVLLYLVPSLRGDSYLSLSLVGTDYGRHLSSPAYNRQYLLMYLMTAAPLLALPWLRGGPDRARRALAAAALMAAAGVAAYTGQRSLALALGGLVAAVAVLLKGRALRWALAGAGLLAALGVAVDLATGAGLLSRLAHTGAGDYYLPIWKVAARLFGAHPVLGVGTGHYAWWGYRIALPDHSTHIVITEIHSTPHQQVLLFLAEGGALLLAAYALSLGPVLGGGVARCRREFDPALCAVLASLAVLLAFSLTQAVLYFRSLWFMFWALAGLVGVLAPPREQGASPAGGLARPLWAGVLVLLLFLGGAQVIQGLHTTPPSFAAGFYHQERFDGLPGRWIGPRAVVVTRPGEKEWRACVSSYLPRLAEDPQRLRFVVNGRLARELIIRGPGWQAVDLPLPQPGPSVIRITASRTWNPARAGSSRDDRDLAAVLAQPPTGGAGGGGGAGGVCPR